MVDPQVFTAAMWGIGTMMTVLIALVAYLAKMTISDVRSLKTVSAQQSNILAQLEERLNVVDRRCNDRKSVMISEPDIRRILREEVNSILNAAFDNFRVELYEKGAIYPTGKRS